MCCSFVWLCGWAWETVIVFKYTLEIVTMKVLIDGKEQTVNDIRIIEEVVVVDEDDNEIVTELHLNFNSEGIVYDLLDPESIDYGLYTSWETYQEMAQKFVGEY